MNPDTFRMRPSRVLRKLRAGELASCFKLNLLDGRVAELAAMHGFDSLWLCMEHVPNDWSEIEKQILAARIYDVDTLVRIARGSYSDYIRPLEMNATGIIVPHIMSLEDARHVVHMTRFHPVGRRPVDGGNADGAYCNIAFTDYIAQANRERMVFLQIEDPEPLSELDEIAALPGYDALLFGPGDFSHAIGVPSQVNHPEVEDARRRVAAAARKHGKFAATVGGLADLPRLFEMGYQWVCSGADVLGLNEYCKQMVAGFAQAVPREK
ncbi:MAG: HpcH/HpaI aldolase family protein [Blastocatellia bacterium]